MRALFTMGVMLFALFGVVAVAAGLAGNRAGLLDLYAGVINLLLCMIAAMLLRWLPPEEPTAQEENTDKSDS